MKPEYKLYLTSLFSLEQNDEGSCSTAVGFIQVWSSVGLKPDVMLIGHGHGLMGGLCCHCWTSALYTELVPIVNRRV